MSEGAIPTDTTSQLRRIADEISKMFNSTYSRSFVKLDKTTMEGIAGIISETADELATLRAENEALRDILEQVVKWNTLSPDSLVHEIEKVIGTPNHGNYTPSDKLELQVNVGDGWVPFASDGEGE